MILDSEFIFLIGNLGFPIAVTAWLLIKGEKTIKALTESNEALKDGINKMTIILSHRLPQTN